MRNVVGHADASARSTCASGGSTVATCTCCVADDGRGFEHASRRATATSGLALMSDLVEQAGGELTVRFDAG